MIVKMKRYEKLAVDYAKSLFPKHSQWDSYIIAKEGYLEGFKMGILLASDIPRFLAEALITFKGNPTIKDLIKLRLHIKKLTKDEVEVEFKDGQHQL